ncbi:uncharacterized protein LOC123266574 [Cotesia glomerata]|uniref:Uncharacterized protein n=1 Tax=Cotesia glomerata TaxID=32391 RepID=A0AAV7HT03_COTGL|nr:uncharacterized protein LOC123266574 [Cotesia glomerata]KAH0534770.1 hypothetical protein KQX54_008213 [Cotesia glomerata]
MAKLPFLLTILIVSFFPSNAFPDIQNITDVVQYARNIVDTIKNSTLPRIESQEADTSLVERLNTTRVDLAKMIERKMNRTGGQATIIRGLRYILKRDNLTVFFLDDAILDLLPPEQKVQININKILINSKGLVEDLLKLKLTSYNMLHGMLQQLKRKLNLQSETYDRAVSDLFVLTMQSEFKFQELKMLVKYSNTLSVTPFMFKRLASGILESRSDELMDHIYPSFAKLSSRRVPGFYKALFRYLVENQDKFKFEDTCDVDLLIQTRIKQIYELALVIDYRVLMMTIATRKYMEILQSGDYNGELLIENQNFINRAQDYLHAMKNLMSKAPREIKRCDLADNMIADYSFYLSNISSTMNKNMISLIPQVANITNNMVVTNMKLQAKNDCVQVQIQQGLLLPGGAIDQSTLKWLSLDDIVPTENATTSFEKVQGNIKVPLVYDQDFTVLRQGNARLNIDDINLPVGYVVTGISFKKMAANDINQWNSNAIGLQVLATPFDYYTGTLNPSETKPSEWLSANELIEMNEYDGTYGKVEVAKVNKFIDFHMRSVSNDSQEVTVPYLDLRPAGRVSLTSLSGIGIVQRESINNDSLLVPKLIAVDHSEFVIATMHPSKNDFFTRSRDYFNNEDYDEDDVLFDAESIEI